MKPVVFITAEIIGLLVLLILLPAVFITDRPGSSSVSGIVTLPLNPGNFYLQTIPNPTRSLTSILLEMKNVALQNHDRITVDLLNSDQNLIYNFTFNGSNVSDPGWVELNFPPVDYESLTLRISADNTFRDTLFMLGPDQHHLNYQSFFRINSFKERLVNQANNQLTKLSQVSPSVYLYLSFLIFLNLCLFL